MQSDAIVTEQDIHRIKDYFKNHPDLDYYFYESRVEVIKCKGREDSSCISSKVDENYLLIAIASKKIHRNAVIGEGSNTTVKRAIDLDDPYSSDSIVVKVFHDPLPAEHLIQEEASRLSLVNLQYRSIRYPINSRYIVMRRVKGISLRDFLVSSQSTASVKLAIAQSLKALQNLHDQGHVHGDAHTNNIFYDHQSQSAQLLDMGEDNEISRNIDKLNCLFEIYRTIQVIGNETNDGKVGYDDLRDWVRDLILQFGQNLSNQKERNFFLLKMRQNTINMR